MCEASVPSGVQSGALVGTLSNSVLTLSWCLMSSFHVQVITRCCDSAELKLTLWRKCLFLLHSSCVQYTLEILIRGNNLSNTYLFFALLPVVCGRQ